MVLQVNYLFDARRIAVLVLMLRRDPLFMLIALGGNAFQSKGDRGTPQEYWRNAYIVADMVASLVERGYKVVLTHGNGPQVGVIDLWMQSLRDKIPPMTLDIAGAMTQGWLGYLLMQSIDNELARRGLLDKVKGVVALVNQVVVRRDDPAWNNPSKYIGAYYSKEEAEKLAEREGWVVKPDPRGGWRRVVPSPDPVDNVEKEAVRKLVDDGWIVVASGGGGIPVVRENNGLRGVEAVIDKDLAAERLATALGTGHFIILTDVEKVYLNYGTPQATPLDEMTIEEAKKYYEEGHFKPGSMGPKVLASIRFVEHGGLEARIGHLKRGLEVVECNSGTRILRKHGQPCFKASKTS